MEEKPLVPLHFINETALFILFIFFLDTSSTLFHLTMYFELVYQLP
jgi:hypothetical protein